MRRWFAVLPVLVLLIALAGAALAEVLPASGTAYVYNPDREDRLNLRAAPRRDAVSLGKYYTGVAVQLLGERKNGYVKVRVDPLEGWMDENYLRTAGDVSEFISVPQTSVTASSANLRAQPAYDAKVICNIGRGQHVYVLGVRDDGWLHVAYTQNGFVRADLLSGTFSYHKASGGQSGAQTAPGAAKTALIKSDDPVKRLNLRSGPSKNGAVLGKYYSGTMVNLLGEERDGWVRVSIGGTAIGYVQAAYLAADGENVKNSMLTRTIQNKSGTGLNLRETPSTKAKSLGTYRNGKQVTVFGVYGGWAHVMVDGKVGYMQADKFDTDEGLTYDAP